MAFDAVETDEIKCKKSQYGARVLAKGQKHMPCFWQKAIKIQLDTAGTEGYGWGTVRKIHPHLGNFQSYLFIPPLKKSASKRME